MKTVNAKFEVKGKILTITVDLSQDHGPSSSGATNTVAKGQESLGEGITAQINVWKKLPKKG